LTQIPEFHEDEFYFRLETDEIFALEDGTPTTSREFEMQYIIHHEIRGSALCQLLGITDIISVAEYYRKFSFNMRRHANFLITNWDDDNDTRPVTSSTVYSISNTRRYRIIELLDGRITAEDRDGRPSPVTDITADQWDDWRIQVFRFGGDITLLGGRGTLTQIPEFHEDEFYFLLRTDEALVLEDGTPTASREFELQYIMRHEISGSALCRLLGIEPCD